MLRVVLLADEVNKLSNGYIDNSAIITPIDINGNTMGQYFDFQIDPQVERKFLGHKQKCCNQFWHRFRKLF